MNCPKEAKLEANAVCFVVLGIETKCESLRDKFKGVNVHPGKLTWNMKNTHLQRKIIFQTFIIFCSM